MDEKKKIENKKIEYYGEIGQEKLHSDSEETVKDVFDNIEIIENYEYPFIVHTFEPIKIILDENYFLERIYENLDEEYGDPDGDYTKPTKKVLTKARELVDVIKKEYKSYMCETNGKTTKYNKDDVLDIVGRENK